ncbi:MAG: barstar family protein [Eubacteriales bacterium]|jgi:ribonuclease inhibitor|nr:barstar family protein [Eubacteriales bacterium]MDD4744571.1 barstar family protein [Eubacteriales bacterium]NLO37027.1 barnase inhibitor [Clostridiaceae bacterium]
MRKVKLNGKKMDTREHAHRHLQKQLRLPAYYGANLDALWDLLSTCGEAIQVTLVNRGDMISALGDYGEKLIQVFKDAERGNDRLRFRIM